MNVKKLFDLSGKTALITGGSRGLGLQFAEALGEMGAKVIITARKAGMNDGAAIQLLAREISTVVREASACDSEDLRRCGTWLNDALDRVMKVTRNLLCVTGRGEVDLGLANASVYLDLVGHTVIGWMWLKQALVAVQKVGQAHEADRDFYQGKLQACAFFFRWELSKTRQWADLLDSLDPTCLDMQDTWF